MIRRERTRPLGSPWGRLRVSVHPLLCAGCWRLRRPTGRRLASFPGNSFTAPMLRLALVEERSQRGCGLGRNAKPSPLFSQESQGMRGAGTWWGSSAGPPGDGACHPEQTRRFPPEASKDGGLWGACHPSRETQEQTHSSWGGGQGHPRRLSWEPGSPWRQDTGPDPGGAGESPGVQ